jgi:hypothetical protein
LNPFKRVPVMTIKNPDSMESKMTPILASQRTSAIALLALLAFIILKLRKKVMISTNLAVPKI